MARKKMVPKGRKSAPTTPARGGRASSSSSGTSPAAAHDVRSERRRGKWSRNVMKEIKYYMKTTHLLIPRLTFCRLCQGILQELSVPGSPMRWQKAALECLQEAAEAFIINLLADSNLLCHHAKRVTLMQHDIRLLRRLRDM